MGKRAVFLDRDGVINRYVYNPEFGTVDSPSNPGEFEFISGAPEAVRALHSLDLLVVVVSNQPGIAKGKFTSALLEATTAKMLDGCGHNIDDVFYCLHHPHASDPRYLSDCVCRKPKPGLLLQAAAKWNIDLALSFMVGDGLTDVQAGRAAGVRTILVNPRKCYLCDEAAKLNAIPDHFVPSLAAAVDVIRMQHHQLSLASSSGTRADVPRRQAGKEASSLRRSHLEGRL